MKRVSICLGILALAVLIGGTAASFDRDGRNVQVMRPWSPGEYPAPDAAQIEGMTAAVDTYTNVYYTFEPMNWQGWTRFDNTSNGLAVATAGNLSPSAAPFGMYSGLKSNLRDLDPCGDNLETQIVFFINSQYPTPAYPGLVVTPFCKGAGGIAPPCQDEMVYSPVIDLAKYSTAPNNIQNASIPAGELPSLGGCLLRFTVYTDLPLENLVFYVWHVRNIENGHYGTWLDRNRVYYDANKHYRYDTIDISDLVTSDSIQVALGVVDMCGVWYGIYGDCAEHTPAPWFDNVSVQRFKTVGPQWYYTRGDLFQDNFPCDSLGGYVRADMARDINPRGDPAIRPGDSIVVSCASPLGGGIDTLPNGRPAVYMHVKAHFIGSSWPVPPPPTVIHGAQLQGSEGIWLSTDGGGWDIIQADYARASTGARSADRFAFDLNDSLFIRGYMIEYYFEATDNAGLTTTLPRGARQLAAAQSPFFGSSYVFEFTCLPTFQTITLYVDDSDGRGSFQGVVQDYWDRTFRDLRTQPTVDRYDINDPTSALSNGLASRAQVSYVDSLYRVIIWDSGDLSSGTIGDGTSASASKVNDCQFLIDYMDRESPGSYEIPPGIWILGDNVAEDLSARTSPQAHALLSDWCGVSLVNGSYFNLTGGIGGGGVVNPLLSPAPGGFPYSFQHFYISGGCPGINSFDVLGAAETGVNSLQYPDYGGQHYYAAVQSQRTNSRGVAIRTMWFGFSYMTIREWSLSDYNPVRNELVHEVLRYYFKGMGPVRDPAGSDETPSTYALARNYPNPFNPATTIGYSVKQRSAVTLQVYNVAGQLVRTLVDGVEDAGSYKAVWDGKNNAGVAAASGIYFYKMEAAGFRATKKMVLLR